MKYLFGPVPSRRLGISLGIDLVPMKYCTLDCIYCEVGRTTNHTLEREEFYPVEAILAELKEYLSGNPELDFITFSGRGEPTLHSGIGRIIDFIKSEYPQYKTAVITNGTLFGNPEVRAELMKADFILPSLDSVGEEAFRRINRPATGLDLEGMIEGLIQFAEEYKGVLNLEIFIVPGINDTDEELASLKAVAEKIKPSLIQINTLDRPGAVSSVKPAPLEVLERVKEYLAPLPVEIVAKVKARSKVKSFNQDIEKVILATIERRPCTDQDLITMTGLHINELNKYLSTMLEEGKIESVEKERGTFFILKGR
jgi:wyosine [tRNA(Phe)-imidazoG37] synthetase (radical SAM superfamily)